MFSEFEAMLIRYKFDIITVSETWLKDNPLLLNHATIPSYKNEFSKREKKRGSGSRTEHWGDFSGQKNE